MSAQLNDLLPYLTYELQLSLNQRLADYNLDLKSLAVLSALWEQQGLTQIQLSKQCNLPTYAITRLLDVMQEKQLVYRQLERDNRRAFQIFLTDEAKALEQDVKAELSRVNAEFLAPLAMKEQQQLLLLLQRLV